MKPAAVVDSSSLIFAFKLDGIEALLRKKYSRLVLPKAVFEETVVEGGKRGFYEVEKIEAAIKRGFAMVEEAPADKKPFYHSKLGRGETEAILLAASKKMDLISDDKKAAIAANALGVSAIPVSAFLVAAARQKVLPKKEAKLLLDQLMLSGYRLKSDAYVKLANEIENA